MLCQYWHRQWDGADPIPRGLQLGKPQIARLLSGRSICFFGECLRISDTMNRVSLCSAWRSSGVQLRSTMPAPSFRSHRSVKDNLLLCLPQSSVARITQVADCERIQGTKFHEERIRAELPIRAHMRIAKLTWSCCPSIPRTYIGLHENEPPLASFEDLASDEKSVSCCSTPNTKILSFESHL